MIDNKKTSTIHSAIVDGDRFTEDDIKVFEQSMITSLNESYAQWNTVCDELTVLSFSKFDKE